MNIRKAAHKFHQIGVFVNSVEYPAVPKSQQRFRISIMATHTKEDIDRLKEAIAEFWRGHKNDGKGKSNAVYSNHKNLLIN